MALFGNDGQVKAGRQPAQAQRLGQAGYGGNVGGTGHSSHQDAVCIRPYVAENGIVAAAYTNLTEKPPKGCSERRSQAGVIGN